MSMKDMFYCLSCARNYKIETFLVLIIPCILHFDNVAFRFFAIHYMTLLSQFLSRIEYVL